MKINYTLKCLILQVFQGSRNYFIVFDFAVIKKNKLWKI
jgi:hypothetical protein